MPDALESAGYRVERHAQHFQHDAEDADFLPEIGKHSDWIFLTHDARQRYVADQRDAIMRSGVAHVIHVGHLSLDRNARLCRIAGGLTRIAPAPWLFDGCVAKSSPAY